MQVKDGVITNMLVGSPAFLSHKFKRGDRVLKIDGEDVDESGAGLTKMLIGSDVPGTDVTVTVKREGDNVFDVTLTRATTLELADKKKMFQLFAQIKDLAHQREDKGPNDSQNADDSIASSSDVGGAPGRTAAAYAISIRVLRSCSETSMRGAASDSTASGAARSWSRRFSFFVISVPSALPSFVVSSMRRP